MALSKEFCHGCAWSSAWINAINPISGFTMNLCIDTKNLSTYYRLTRKVIKCKAVHEDHISLLLKWLTEGGWDVSSVRLTRNCARTSCRKTSRSCSCHFYWLDVYITLPLRLLYKIELHVGNSFNCIAYLLKESEGLIFCSCSVVISVSTYAIETEKNKHQILKTLALIGYVIFCSLLCLWHGFWVILV